MKKGSIVDNIIAGIKRGWLAYGKKGVRSRKSYEPAVKNEAFTPLGPASEALLDYINNANGQIVLKDCIQVVQNRVNIWNHNRAWWKTRIQALATEGRIDATLYRYGDKVTTIYRKKRVGEARARASKPELGPASKALLERINMESGVVHTLEVIAWAQDKTGIKQNEYWWFRRIAALAIEGHIEDGVDRTLDIVHVYFQRKEAGA